MRLTAKELEQMKSVDIGAVAPESLPDVSGMTFDNALSRKERISRFLQTVKNPYCFCIGGVGVKIEFAESGPSLQDKLTDFLLRQRSGLAVLVTGEVGLGLVAPYRMGRIFADILGKVNQQLAAQADEAYFMACGFPIRLK